MISLTPQLPQIDARRVQIGGKRFYAVGSALYPSITTVLSVVGKPALVAWAKRVALEAVRAHLAAYDTITAEQLEEALILAAGEPERQRDAAASRGSDRHAAIAEELSAGGDPYRIRDRLGIVRILATEYTLVSTRHGFAGTCDVVALDDAGRLVLVDWKTGGVWPEHALQVGGYALALEEQCGHPVARGYVVGLKGPQPVVYAVDLAVAREGFLSALSLYTALANEQLLVNLGEG